MKVLLILVLIFKTIWAFSQREDFKVIIQNPATSVKFQMESGQFCWSYATCSFLESELIRMGKGEHDLSEDYFIYHGFIDKAFNYVLRQGYTGFKDGGLAHDVIRTLNEEGIVPAPYYKIDYTPYTKGPKPILANHVKTVITEDLASQNWQKHYLALLNSYFIKRADRFTYKDKTLSSKTFAEHLELDGNNYSSITSFTHHPFYEEFILEVPDNYANGSYLNIPLNEFIQIVDSCLMKGYTLVWDGCISGNGYSNDRGLAMLPANRYLKEQNLNSEIKENETNQQKRQIAFESLQTTDDHLMHIVGIAQNVNGNKFYIIKDSGGEYGPYKGYLYMSEEYFKMNTISITLNKTSLPEFITDKINKKEPAYNMLQ
ncbi:C1 family peptidase [Carboxylicivirga sp. RSCT41]|uniref:C1 family peptidase n=1 Tax=Carboxylicivirga agarovorans TaxID=3417570 RepID=UPI003D335A13